MAYRPIFYMQLTTEPTIVNDCNSNAAMWHDVPARRGGAGTELAVVMVMTSDNWLTSSQTDGVDVQLMSQSFVINDRSDRDGTALRTISV